MPDFTGSIAREYLEYVSRLTEKQRKVELGELRTVVNLHYAAGVAVLGCLIADALANPQSYRGLEHVYKAFIF